MKLNGVFYVSIKAKDFLENVVQLDALNTLFVSEKYNHETTIVYNSECST